MNVKHAAAAHGKIGDPRAVEPLIDALSTDMWLQFPAAIALGDIGDSRTVDLLISLLEMPGVNVPAIQALGKLAHPSALGPLSGLLDEEEPSLREWSLEAVALSSLVELSTDRDMGEVARKAIARIGRSP
jgi:HEAT repeat protein